MFLKQLCPFIALLILLVGCKDSPKTQAVEDAITTVEAAQDAELPKVLHKTGEATAMFTDDKVSMAYTQYIEVKTSLVNSDGARASQMANDLMTTLANIGVDQEALLAVQMLKESKTLDGQRQGLANLTPFIEIMIKSSLATGAVYKQYCPMALKNKGAYWLANSKTILNPYFGDAMLSCGSVSDSIVGSLPAVEEVK